jgi:hypothetical protein
VGIGGTIQLYNISNRLAEVDYRSKLFLTGNFEATVSFDRSALGSCGGELVVWFAHHEPSTTGWLTCYCGLGPSEASSLWFQGIPNFPTLTYPTTATTGVFRIRRLGTTLYADANVDNGYVGIRTSTDPAFVAPVRVGLLLAQQGYGPPPNYMVFDNLSVHDDGVLCPLAIERGVNSTMLKWPGSTLESTPSLSPESWATVTNAPSVNGWYNTLTVNPPEPARFFRLCYPISYY